MAARKKGADKAPRTSGPTVPHSARQERGQRVVQVRCSQALQERVARLREAGWALADLLEAGVERAESGRAKKST